jgi:two-component system nitrogen regulation sensor histidine kinase GlnL
MDWLVCGILLLDDQTKVIHANTAAENMLGLSLSRMRGKGLDEIFPETDRLLLPFHEPAQNEAVYFGYELVLSFPEGDRHLSFAVTMLDNTPIRAILELWPIDTQKKIEQEERLHLQEKATRMMLRNLAHEIKNPLGGLRGAAQLLEEELPESLQEYTQVIIKEADRLQYLMDRLLSTTQTRPVLTKVNIHELLERVRSLVLMEYRQLAIIRDYDISLPDLTADKNQLIQALLNIVRNAAQALAGQGQILFRTRALRQVTVAKKNYRLAIKIDLIDHGPGVPSEVLENLFYPLVTGRKDGTGLGLSVSQAIVREHGGMIECDSKPGHTRFSVILPLEEWRK